MSKTSQENKAKKALNKPVVEETKTVVKAAKKSRKASTDEVAEKVTVTEVKEAVTTTTEEAPAEEAIAKKTRVRGKKYQKAKKLIDVNKFYLIKDAVKLVKSVSFSKFEGKIEAHVTVIEEGNLGEITFPHFEAASKKIVVLNDTILAEIKDGKVNFDVLIATPTTMPKLLPFAKLLGPKGLMPNPKAGTLTDKPEDAIKRLSVAKTMIKTEKKAPVVHIVIAKVSQPEAEIEANVAELIKVIKAQKIKKLALCPTMGPSVKVLIEK